MLDEATGRWGLRVNRVEIKAIDPPQTIKDAMQKQMRAERDKRASILTAEGARRARSSPPRATSRAPSCAPRASGRRRILRAEGEARSIDQVFSAVHRNDLDPKVLAYQYLQTLPELARGEGNTFWVIPSEVTSALSGIAQAFARPVRGAGPGSRVRAPHVGTRRHGPDRRADVNGSGRAADRLQAGEPARADRAGGIGASARPVGAARSARSSAGLIV